MYDVRQADSNLRPGIRCTCRWHLFLCAHHLRQRPRPSAHQLRQTTSPIQKPRTLYRLRERLYPWPSPPSLTVFTAARRYSPSAGPAKGAMQPFISTTSLATGVMWSIGAEPTSSGTSYDWWARTCIRGGSHATTYTQERRSENSTIGRIDTNNSWMR